MLRNANPKSFSAIYIVCGYTDMRYGIDKLASIVDLRYHISVFEPDTLFLFCGKRPNKIKGLVWEGDGFLLLTKRIEDGHFIWPRNSTEIRNLSSEQFKSLMSGFSIDSSIRVSHPEKTA